MPKGAFDLRAWARLGAERRLTELREEMGHILAAFPELRSTSGGVGIGNGRRRRRGGESGGAVEGVVAMSGRKRKRRTMSAEARAKISAAQKKRWAKQKRTKAS